MACNQSKVSADTFVKVSGTVMTSGSWKESNSYIAAHSQVCSPWVSANTTEAMKQSSKGETELLKTECAGQEFNTFVSPWRTIDDFMISKGAKGAWQRSQPLDVIKLPQRRLWGLEAEDYERRIRREGKQLQQKIRRTALRKEKITESSKTKSWFRREIQTMHC